MKNSTKVLVGVLTVAIAAAGVYFSSGGDSLQGKLKLNLPKTAQTVSNKQFAVTSSDFRSMSSDFNPLVYTTRAEFAEELVEVLGWDTTPCGKENIFVDLPSSHENCPAIKKLYEEGIIWGYWEGGREKFLPNSYVNKAEMVRMIRWAFLLNNPESGYSDVSRSDWFNYDIAGLEQIGILDGNGLFHPGDKATVKFRDNLLKEVKEYVENL